MQENMSVVQVGIGPLGRRLARHLIEERKAIEYVGAVDINPDIVGKPLSRVAGLEKDVGVRIEDEVEEVLKNADPDIVIYTTVSSLEGLLRQAEPAINYGIDVISTTERLSYPWIANEELAEKYNDLAERKGSTVLGTGINPGFLMDVRPSVLSLGCAKVDKIEVTRRIDAGLRRRSFQKKIGVTMEKEEFKRILDEGSITGHVGLEESISLTADNIGWKLDEIRVGSVRPEIAKEEVSSQFYTVEEGQIKGISQKASGMVTGEEKISLKFSAFLGATPTFDKIHITGEPDVNVKTQPCWDGDTGTVGVVANLIPTVKNAPPGILTMKDIIPASFKLGV